ncbi:MAG TPA: IS630 family transposase [Candidatus Acidoferrales bacterium]|nr:IS630 family transposase [Candidatus Acidoferrales bacterium]
MWESARALEVSDEARRTLEGWVSARTLPQRIVLRARIVLLAAQGLANRRIAQAVRASRPTVLLWRNRFAFGGVAALLEETPGRGRPATIAPAKVKRIVEATIQTRPRGATHWSTRTMAHAQGVSHAMVQRIWDAHGLQPHRVKTFKLSRDKRFVEKLTDVVGVYLNPPDKAVILCVDEKSQIQALDRTQPGMPIKKGRCGTPM